MPVWVSEAQGKMQATDAEGDEMMKYEECESKVANLFASMEQMTSDTEKLRVLTKIVELEAKEIAVLMRVVDWFPPSTEVLVPVQDESRD